ncbi:Nramp family divalent metal transporter [Pseudonocardia nigra]|uniref:Nramp family divalent metal transporter n=1 Tax=Pseudonocardia nigra TaxID=1921578 RepID=UPI0027E24B36|nr:Nramp family divalent metal transporter [Pseudonocardia nigra]
MALSDRDRQEFAEHISSRHLPPVSYRDLPEPKRLRQIAGASIIITATAIGSGEFVLWPYITSQVGLVLMWAAVVGFLTQYFINMEVTRYTLATGETAVTGFTRLWKPWGVLFILMTILPNIWPGWGTGAATTLTYIIGGGNVVAIAIAALVAIGIALTLSPVVYQTVEKVETVLVALIAVFLVLVVSVATTGEAWGTFVTDFSNFGQFPPFEAVGGIAALLGAIAFAGAGGANNLVQSNWVRDKGMGMGVYLPKVTSPFTGESHAEPGTGYTFRETEDNMRRWRGWWRVANLEQFFTFFVLGCTTLIILSVLAYSTVFGQALPEDDFEFILLEGQVLGDRFGDWFSIAFWAAGTIALFSTELGILDYVSRLTADTLKVSVFPGSTKVTESRIYFVVIWSMIVFGIVILLSGLQQPVALLIIAASLGGVVMFVYSVLLILINRKYLPKSIRISGVRLAVMIWAVLFYGYFSVLLVGDQLGLV